MIADAKGNLFGTTEGSGADNVGTVFKLAPDGKLVVLNAFDGQGDSPVANLTAGKKKFLYGTTEFGSDGTVFRVKE